MPIRKYNVTVRLIAGTSYHTVKAYDAKDAAAQVEIANKFGPHARVEVVPDEEIEVESAAPDRIFTQFRKDLADVVPPMGTQEVERRVQEMEAMFRRNLVYLMDAINPKGYRAKTEKGVPVSDAFEHAVYEAERLVKRNAHLEGAVSDAFQDTANKLKALREKFDQALKVIEVFERGASSDAKLLELMEAARLKFRQ